MTFFCADCGKMVHDAGISGPDLELLCDKCGQTINQVAVKRYQDFMAEVDREWKRMEREWEQKRGLAPGHGK